MDEDWLQELEELLLKPEVRHDAAALSKLLAPDFHEVGASGRQYSRDDIMAALPAETAPEGYAISDFVATELDINVAMVTYRLETRSTGENTPRRTIRTSLWRLSDDGWQIFFHQGTPAAD
jgi:hypothetical protein